jgi:hypothetical protein
MAPELLQWGFDVQTLKSDPYAVSSHLSVLKIYPSLRSVAHLKMSSARSTGCTRDEWWVVTDVYTTKTCEQDANLKKGIPSGIPVRTDGPSCT